MQIGRHDVRISNPDKLFFPERGLTKGELVAYYLDVAACVAPAPAAPAVPHEALPERVEGEFFHQKRVPPHPDFVDEQFVRFPSGHTRSSRWSTTRLRLRG